MERPEFIYETQYGYTRDIYMLPVGTIFSVNNGGWDGEIIEKDEEKHIQIKGGRSILLKEDFDYRMCLRDVKQKEVEIKTPLTTEQHTEELEKRIHNVVKKYHEESGAHITTDSNYSYGSIAIRIKEEHQ